MLWSEVGFLDLVENVMGLLVTQRVFTQWVKFVTVVTRVFCTS